MRKLLNAIASIALKVLPKYASVRAGVTESVPHRAIYGHEGRGKGRSLETTPFLGGARERASDTTDYVDGARHVVSASVPYIGMRGRGKG